MQSCDFHRKPAKIMWSTLCFMALLWSTSVTEAGTSLCRGINSLTFCRNTNLRNQSCRNELPKVLLRHTLGFRSARIGHRIVMKGERRRACSDFFPMYLAQSSHLTQSRSHQRSCQLPGVIPIGDSHITGSNQQFVPLASPGHCRQNVSN